MPARLSRPLRPLVTGLVAALVGACEVGPNFTAPPAPATPQYTAAGDRLASTHQRVVPGAPVAADWWTAFRSPDLDAVERRALADNKSLAGLEETLAEAREQVRATSGALFPQATLGATGGRQKYGVALFGPANFKILPFTYYTVGPQVSYLLDLAGGEHRAVERQLALATYQGYETDAARLSLTGNVVSQILGIASAKAQIATLQQIVTDDAQNAALVDTARRAGSATLTDLLSARTQLANDQTLLAPLQQQVSVASDALSVLVGAAPADWQVPDFTLAELHLPDTLPLSLPSALVRARPDIMAAEAQLHAASAAVGVATADLYPSITLSANVTQQALSPDKLFNGAADAYAFGAGLTAPIFNGGMLHAKKRAAEDAYRASLDDYQQTVLEAFAQVADVLQALDHDAQEIRAEQQALDTARSLLSLARTSYQVGNIGVLQVLDAERQYNQAALEMAKARAQQYQDTALLYLALGGGALTPPQTIAAKPF
jgi:NodT family efflux transporter outer membrane factor (OMF) lipoprotein